MDKFIVEALSGKDFVEFFGSEMYVTCDLDGRSHKNFYSDFIGVSELPGGFLLFLSNFLGLSIGIQFFFEDDPLSVSYSPANQLQDFDVPESANKFRLIFRFSESVENAVISYLKFERKSFLLEELGNRLSFPDVLHCISDQRVGFRGFDTKNPIILMETLFCDTETDDLILRRYFSYFCGLFGTVVSQEYGNYIWFIYVSSDKESILKKIKSLVDKFYLNNKVYVIGYDHPVDGYNTHSEEHIMRRRAPNRTIPSRRDSLFQKALASLQAVDLSDFDIIVRIGVDDDDFFTARHLANVSAYAMNLSDLLNPDIGEALVGFRNLMCAYYFPTGEVIVDTVKFSRVVHGSKFSVAKGRIPSSPFPIKERFEEYSESGKVLLFDVEDNEPGFVYNRHGNNFSTQRKNHFYLDRLSVVGYSTEEDFYRSLLGGP